MVIVMVLLTDSLLAHNHQTDRFFSFYFVALYSVVATGPILLLSREKEYGGWQVVVKQSEQVDG